MVRIGRMVSEEQVMGTSTLGGLAGIGLPAMLVCVVAGYCLMAEVT